MRLLLPPFLPTGVNDTNAGFSGSGDGDAEEEDDDDDDECDDCGDDDGFRRDDLDILD
ncbi:hypothetical protein HDU76_004591 [Blyttiomyces sp. JEL0837]|nr:hypothetical protein HDU76_004591 [Blyttiomyces sp. JEL0837]